MIITNKYNLPKAMVHALSHDRYDAGYGDVSCTTLIAPAQQFQLGLKHGEDTTEDASDRIWSLIGSAVHYMIENAVTDMRAKGLWRYTDRTEQRFYHTVGGKKVSAQIDMFESGELSDFKITSVWTVKHALEEGKFEWEAQLNIQRYLMEKNGETVDSLFVIAITRDWNKSGMLRDKDYPPRVAKIPIKMWDMQKTEDYIMERIQALYAEHLVPCTPDECWEKPTKYALMKKGRQSAIRLLDEELLVMPYAVDKGLAVQDGDDGHWELKKDHYIEIRQGARLRCESYCDVMPFCEQYKDWKEKTDELR